LNDLLPGVVYSIENNVYNSGNPQPAFKVVPWGEDESFQKEEGRREMGYSGIVTGELIKAILKSYSLSPNGIHGIKHWARVLENGRRLAAITGANVEVLDLFAVFHDSKRVNDGRDNDHGKRGADFALTLRGRYFDISDEDFQLLHKACSMHTDGFTNAEVTIQSCWDSDRLDLGRVHKTPKPDKLCTHAAKNPDIISWAIDRSKTGFVPSWLWNNWGIRL